MQCPRGMYDKTPNVAFFDPKKFDRHIYERQFILNP